MSSAPETAGLEAGRKQVTVIGQGYIGLPLAVGIAAAGHRVQAVESDPARLARLRRASSYIVDVSDEELAQVSAAGNFHACGSVAESQPAEIYLVAVPTPVTGDGQPDLRYVQSALADLATTLRPGALVAIESTLYPGATRNRLAPRLHELSGLQLGTEVLLAYSPQRIDPGRSGPVRAIPKVVAGLDELSLRAAVSFYSTVYDEVVPVSDCETAEFAKLYENTFRYLNVAFVNELARAAHAMGIDFREVSAVAETKPFGFMPFSHGPGVGGHCLPNNARYLAHSLAPFGGSSLLAAATAVNDGMPGYTVERLRAVLAEHGRSIEGSSLLLLGLSYKSGVADTRNSPTFAIARLITAAGGTVAVADPVVDAQVGSADFVRVELTGAECQRADAVLLITDHPAFDHDLIATHARVILDCRGALEPSAAERL